MKREIKTVLIILTYLPSLAGTQCGTPLYGGYLDIYGSKGYGFRAVLV